MFRTRSGGILQNILVRKSKRRCCSTEPSHSHEKEKQSPTDSSRFIYIDFYLLKFPAGNILSSPTKCVADGEECPCGDNTVKCNSWRCCFFVDQSNFLAAVKGWSLKTNPVNAFLHESHRISLVLPHLGTFEDWSYCESTGIGCPMTCAADEKLCDPISFTAAGGGQQFLKQWI